MGPEPMCGTAWEHPTWSTQRARLWPVGCFLPLLLREQGFAAASAISHQGSQGTRVQGKLNGADMHRLWAVDCSAAETKKAIEALVTLRISIVCGTWELIKMHSPHS